MALFFFIFLLYHLLDLFVCFIVSTGQLKILHVTRKDVVCPPLLHASIYIQNRSTRHSFYLTHLRLDLTLSMFVTAATNIHHATP